MRKLGSVSDVLLLGKTILNKKSPQLPHESFPPLPHESFRVVVSKKQKLCKTAGLLNQDVPRNLEPYSNVCAVLEYVLTHFNCIPKPLDPNDPGNVPDDTTAPGYTPGEMQQFDCLTELNILIASYTAHIQNSEAQQYMDWYHCVQGCIAEHDIADSLGCWERLLISGEWLPGCDTQYATCGCGNQPQLSERDQCVVLALIYIDTTLLPDLSNACTVYNYVIANYDCLPQPLDPGDIVTPGDLPDDWDDDGGNNAPGTDGPYNEAQRKPIWWYHSDHLGSSTYLTDNFGRPSHYYETLPFGEMIVEHNQSSYYKDPYPTTNTGTYDNKWKFNGKELDEATQMYYYGARYYDPRISIFVSLDPLAEQTMEPYLYTGNNPINFVDPTGMSKNDWYQNQSTGDYEYWEGSEEKEGYKHLGKSATINVNSSEGTQIGTLDLNSDGSANYTEGNNMTSINNATADFGFVSGNRVRAGNWGISENLMLGSFSSYTFGAAGVSATPFPKSWLQHTPEWFHGGYGRGWVKGKTSLTSIGSFGSRRLGLGGEFGRALPGNLLKGGMYQLGMEGLHDAMLINSDSDLLKRYDANQSNNPYRDFVPEGFRMLRIDNKQRVLNRERYENNQKKNPYRGFVF